MAARRILRADLEADFAEDLSNVFPTGLYSEQLAPALKEDLNRTAEQTETDTAWVAANTVERRSEQSSPLKLTTGGPDRSSPNYRPKSTRLESWVAESVEGVAVYADEDAVNDFESFAGVLRLTEGVTDARSLCDVPRDDSAGTPAGGSRLERCSGCCRCSTARAVCPVDMAGQ